MSTIFVPVVMVMVVALAAGEINSTISENVTTTTLVPATSTTTYPFTGSCIGNDSRCGGKGQQQCSVLSAEGADCEWVWNEPTTSPSKNVAGSCIGKDSRCGGKNQQQCSALTAEGTDCEWEQDTSDTITGSCSGNDSRCSKSNQAGCARLAIKGSDCWWEHAEGPEGTCLGNDSRCAASSMQMCDKLSQDGADCKWRAAFSLTGSFLLDVSNAEGFVDSPEVQSAAAQSMENISGVPVEFISTHMDEVGNQTRRLRSTRRLTTEGNVVFTYAIYVPGDAPPTPTASEAVSLLTSTTPIEFGSIFVLSLEGVLGEGAFTVVVLDVSNMSLVVSTPSETPASTTVGTLAPRSPSEDTDAAMGLSVFTAARLSVGTILLLSL